MQVARVVLFASILIGPLVAQEPTVVSLSREDVFVEEPVVRLTDVASIQGGSPATRKQLGSLEVTELKRVGAVDRVSHARVEYLLLLAGVETSNVRVEGDQVNVELRSRQSTDQKVTHAVKAAIASKLGVSPSDVVVQLTRPLPELERTMQRQRVTLRAFPLKTPRLGARSVRLGVYANGNMVKTFTASVDAKVARRVPIATRLVASRQKLAANDFEWKLVAVQQLDVLPESTDLVGQQMNRRFNPAM